MEVAIPFDESSKSWFQSTAAGAFGGQFGLIQSFTWKGVTRVALEDRVLHGRVVLECSQPVTVSAAAHRTVSQSEDGFEKIMQAVTLNVVLDVAPQLLPRQRETVDRGRPQPAEFGQVRGEELSAVFAL